MSFEQHVADYANKARIYAESRPDYADAAFKHIVSATMLTSDSVVADIGAGTGKSCAGLLAYIGKVLAVDSSEEMLGEAVRLYGGNPVFEARIGSAEQIPISDSSVDLVVVGQALHWFDVNKAKSEFMRIMRPEAKVCILWNDFGNTPRPPVEDLMLAGYEEQSFDASYSENWDRYIKGELSSHYSPRPGDAAYEPFVEERLSRFNQRAKDGWLQVALVTRLVLGCIDAA